MLASMDRDVRHLSQFPAGYLVVDQEFNILEANAYVHETLASDAEVVGFPLSSILTKASNILLDSYIKPLVLVEKLVEQIQVSLRGVDGLPIPMVVNIRSAEGLYYWTLFKCGKRESLIRELKDTKTALEQRGERLSRMLRDQDQMFAIIGHELRTPAATLSMQLDELGTEVSATELDKMKGTMLHLFDVIDSMRISRGDYTPNLVTEERTFSLTELITGVVEELKPSASLVSMDIELELSDSCDQLHRGHPKYLKTVFRHLLENAITHSKGNRVRLLIESGHQHEFSAPFALHVDDDGVGIKAAEVERVFKPYERGEAVVSGNGLGLAVCQTLLKHLPDGRLSYAPGQTSGSRFSCYFSLIRTTNSTLDAVPEALLKGKRVLFVEDTPMLRMLGQKLLEKHGARVEVAEHGQLGLELALSNQYDFVVTDIMMQVMDGFQMTSSLVRQDFKTPIVGLSGATVGNEFQRLRECGAVAVLAKPLNVEQLAEVLRPYLQ